MLVSLSGLFNSKKIIIHVMIIFLILIYQYKPQGQKTCPGPHELGRAPQASDGITALADTLTAAL